jgi:hypothetical protein
VTQKPDIISGGTREPAAGSSGEVEDLRLELEGLIRKVAKESWCG